MIIILLLLFLAAAVWAVMTTGLMRSVIGLALTSVMLSMVLFYLDAPLAAVFELSVCAGLIPVFFITAVSFTSRMSNRDYPAKRKERAARFWFLPVLLGLVGMILWQCPAGQMLKIAHQGGAPLEEVRRVIWNLRRFDLLGQILVLLAGAWGVSVFFKEKKS